MGSNFPLAGYYREATVDDGVDGREPGDRYFVTDVRNTARLPWYVRVDVRGNYVFHLERSRLTLFVEVINLLNRTDLGPGEEGFIDPSTFRVNDLAEELFPVLPSAGILWEF